MIKNPRKFRIGTLEIWENGQVYRVNNDNKSPIEPTRFKSRSGVRLMTTYFKDKKQHTVYLSREIAKRFVPNPNNYRWVSFKDGDTTNVSSDNLKWISDDERIAMMKETRKRNQVCCLNCHHKYDRTRNVCPKCDKEEKRKRHIAEVKSNKLETISEKYKHVDKGKLPKKWQSILAERIAGKTFAEIGEEKGVSGEYIRQILKGIETGYTPRSSQKAIDRIECLEEKIHKYRLEKEYLEKTIGINEEEIK